VKPMNNRRDFYRTGTFVLGGLMTLALAVPGVAYLLSPLRRKSAATKIHELTSLDRLEIGVPQAFVIKEERNDAWIKYPREPVGLVWLVRQPPGASPAVIAFTAECPHLGCAVTLNDAKSAFRCPCHDSAFSFDGQPRNQIPPRGMDTLEVELTTGSDPKVRVRFERFRAQQQEKIPVV
jgi:menaquinol-cytochrome c reductase iron-sulfur subunit